jgi:hypothetical protein
MGSWHTLSVEREMLTRLFRVGSAAVAASLLAVDTLDFVKMTGVVDWRMPCFGPPNDSKRRVRLGVPATNFARITLRLKLLACAHRRHLRGGADERRLAGPSLPQGERLAQALESVASAADHFAERQASFRSIDLETFALSHAAGRGAGGDDLRAALAVHPGLIHNAGGRVSTQAAARVSQPRQHLRGSPRTGSSDNRTSVEQAWESRSPVRL